MATGAAALPASAAPEQERSAQRVAGDAPEEVAAAAKEAADEGPAEDALGAHDRELLEEAVAAGDDEVTVMVAATDADDAAGAEAAVRAAGGTVERAYDEIGYVRATLPTGKVDRLAGDRAVGAVDLKEVLEVPDPRPEAGDGGARGGSGTTYDAPDASTPAANPYMPTHETGAVDFTRRNPAWDGRGITIGVVDTGVDLDHPALATTSTGERKVVDWVTGTDPVYDGDGTWRPMLTDVSGPSFAYAGATWTAPEGTYLVSRFLERVTAGSDVGGDVNRDGDTTDAFGVLYDPATHETWVDADGDLDFTDETAMLPYRERFDVGHFGVDDPATAVSERLPFVVEHREDVDLSPYGGPYVGRTADYVNIGIVSGAHGTHVAGIAAGHGLFGGEVDGAAPGARIVSSRACLFASGCTNVALTEGMADVVINRDVDVVNMSIGGLPAFNDGGNARAELYTRLIDRYGVQLVISAGNSGPGLNTVGDPSVAPHVVSVAASVSRETWAANYGSRVRTPMALFNFSSRGPREDGGPKPTLAAPGSAVSTIPAFMAGSAVPEAGYALPPGYGMFNGTSMASPQAAGGVALLLSAARAQGVPVTPAQLRTAMTSTADPIRGTSTAGQGAGLLDVPAAWGLLRTGRVVGDDGMAVSAPVCSELSGFLPTPGTGVGVYDRCAPEDGGPVVGQAKAYPVTLTRTTGPAGSLRVRLTVAGDSRTWKAPRTVVLRRDVPTTVTLTARPRTAGAHAAILRVDDPRTVGVDAHVHAVAVAATPLTAPGFATSVRGSVDRNATTSYFVTVPEGTEALQVVLSGIATGSQTRFVAFHPYGVPVESTSSLACFTNFSDPRTCDAVSRSYTDPTPGVWEIEVESRRTSPFLANPYRLDVAVQAVDVAPERVVLESARVGEATPVEWEVTNELGPVTVVPEGGPLQSARVTRPTIGDAEQLTYEVVVPEGSASLTATIGSPSDPGADLDLFVRDASGATVGQSADGDSEESVTVPSPAPGTYTVVVDGYAVPAGTTEFDYVDAFVSPALGELTAPSTALELGGGESATLTGALTARGDTGDGRQLLGEVRLVTDEGATVGSGTVVVESVTTG